MARSDIVYTPKEIFGMLNAPKKFPSADFDPSLSNIPAVRSTVGEHTKQWEVFSQVASPEMQFEVEARVGRMSFGISLHGRILDRPWQSLVRYNTHVGEHDTPDLCPTGGFTIGAGELHRHVYCEKALLKLGRWDFCAERLKVPEDVSSMNDKRLFLVRSFLADLHIRLSDPETYREVHNFGAP